MRKGYKPPRKLIMITRLSGLPHGRAVKIQTLGSVPTDTNMQTTGLYKNYCL